MEIESCTLCPRKCGANRQKGAGICRASNKIKIASFGLHKWEEPCICGDKGSGTVFFCGCTLKCVFCQNYEISQGDKGIEITLEQLCEVFLKLQKAGAHNINLVNPTHYAHLICDALKQVKPYLKIPVMYNTGGYDRVQTLKNFEGLVDIWLPDIKYYDSRLSFKYSGVDNYFDCAIKAVEEMYRQHTQSAVSKTDSAFHADNVYDDKGNLIKGVIIRHLCLPSCKQDSFAVLEQIKQHFGEKNTCISLMSQYFPTHKAGSFKEINRRLTTLEYHKIIDYAIALGFENGFTQQRESASKDYVPNFDILNKDNL